MSESRRQYGNGTITLRFYTILLYISIYIYKVVFSVCLSGYPTWTDFPQDFIGNPVELREGFSLVLSTL